MSFEIERSMLPIDGTEVPGHAGRRKDWVRRRLGDRHGANSGRSSPDAAGARGEGPSTDAARGAHSTCSAGRASATTTVIDDARVLRNLTSGAVDFIVVGGFAVIAHGFVRATADLDICYARDAENVSRLVAVLRDLNARPRNWPEGVPFILDDQTIRNGDTFTFVTDAGDLDILGTPSGTTGYPDLARAAIVLNLGDGLNVEFAGLDDLIRMKRAAGRSKDYLDLEALAKIRGEPAGRATPRTEAASA